MGEEAEAPRHRSGALSIARHELARHQRRESPRQFSRPDAEARRRYVQSGFVRRGAGFHVGLRSFTVVIVP